MITIDAREILHLDRIVLDGVELTISTDIIREWGFVTFFAKDSAGKERLYELRNKKKIALIPAN